MNKKQLERKERLLPGGIPRWIRCYDNGGVDKEGGTTDRYTVVYSNLKTGWCSYVGMSGSPYHPQGFCQHGENRDPIDRPKYSHLGKKIKFQDLPEDCQKVVMSDYCDFWEIDKGE